MKETYKVVDIITPYQLVLNCGADDGIQLNDYFLIYGLGKIIKDFETSADLEQLELIRGKGKIIHVQKRISTIESIEEKETPKKIRKINNDWYPGYPVLYSFPNVPREEIEITREQLPFKEAQIGDNAKKL